MRVRSWLRWILTGEISPQGKVKKCNATQRFLIEPEMRHTKDYHECGEVAPHLHHKCIDCPVTWVSPEDSLSYI